MLIRSKYSKAGITKARLESYHRGYHVGIRAGIKKSSKFEKPRKSACKARKAASSRKFVAAEKLKAFHRGYHVGESCGARRERAQQAVDAMNRSQSLKVRRAQNGWAWRKRLVEAKKEAYKQGARLGVRRERSKQARHTHQLLVEAPPAKKKTKSKASSDRRRIVGKQPAPAWLVQSGRLWFSLVSRVASSSKRSTAKRANQKSQVDMSQALRRTRIIGKQARPLAYAAKAVSSWEDDLARFQGDAETPVAPARAVPPANRKHARPASKVQGDSAALSLAAAPTPARSRGNTGTERLRSFLEDPTGATKEAAAFQLRCKLLSEAQNCKTVVVVVGGKCRLWKLNQIIAESFDAGAGAFLSEPDQGATVDGSCLMVSRQMHPGQCSNVLVCSAASAHSLDIRSSYLDDKDYSVAELFRGKSTRTALFRDPADATQKVIFSSPLLGAEVSVSLDGIMLDRYDSGNRLDKQRRQGNGRRALPRIVGSSFLGFSEIEARNDILAGSKDRPNFLREFDESWSAIHANYRRSQRQPLFSEDGADFDPNELF